MDERRKKIVFFWCVAAAHFLSTMHLLGRMTMHTNEPNERIESEARCCCLHNDFVSDDEEYNNKKTHDEDEKKQQQ